MEDIVNQEQQIAATALVEPQVEDGFDPETALAAPKRRPALLLGGILLLVALLGSASFMAARMLAARDQAPEGEGNMVMMGSGGGRAVAVQKSFSIEPAKELPSEPATAHGVYQRREDNSIFVGTGKITAMAKGDASGVTDMKLTADGPEVEIVVTHDTEVWADVTPMRFDQGDQPDGDVQQVVKPGSLDDLDTLSTLQVWGERNGDRIIARVLAYRNAN